jgi:hypothetical protein
MLDDQVPFAWANETCPDAQSRNERRVVIICNVLGTWRGLDSTRSRE